MVAKLDVGCGGRGSRWPGFLGVDRWPHPNGVPAEWYVQLDFVKDVLPWQSQSMEEIICLHVIEHMSPHDGRILIQRGFDLLAPRGSMIITTPDLKILCKAYLEGDREFWNKTHDGRPDKLVWPGRTLADRLNWAIHQDTHVWVYDFDSLLFMAEDTLKNEPDAMVSNVRVDSSVHRFMTRRDHETGIVIYRK